MRPALNFKIGPHTASVWNQYIRSRMQETEGQIHVHRFCSWCNSVDMVCRLRVGRPTNRGLIPDKGRNIFSSKWPDRFCPVFYRTGSLSAGVKQQEREASSAEVKNAWPCTFNAPRKFMAWCLIKGRTTYFTLCSFVACSQHGDFVLDSSSPRRALSAR